MGRRYDKNLEKIRQKMLEAVKKKLPPGTVAPTQIAADPTTDDQLYLDVSRQINRWENGVISFDDLMRFIIDRRDQIFYFAQRKYGDYYTRMKNRRDTINAAIAAES